MQQEIKVLDHGYIRLVDRMGTDFDIVNAARVSYSSNRSKVTTPEEDKKLLFYLYKNRHTSPFEMVKVKFQIKLPIFVMRQYVRHRMQNLNEVSARYSELPNEFYIPERWREQDFKNKQGSIDGNRWDAKSMSKSASPTHEDFSWALEDHCKDSYELYQSFLKEGIAREMARMVLPVNIYTECVVCWDIKNLLHFISLRDDSHAQAEIQEYGKVMKEFLKELFPWTMEAYERYKFVLTDTNPQ